MMRFDSGKAEVQSLESEGEPGVIDAHKLENGCLQIMNVNRVLGHVESSSSVFPKEMPGLLPPPAIHMVKACG